MFPSNSKIPVILKKIYQVFLRLFQKKKLFKKSWMFLAFPEKAHKIRNFCFFLFVKVIDMTRLYILITFDIKRFLDLFKIPKHI